MKLPFLYLRSRIIMKRFKNWLWECLVFWLHFFLFALAWILIPIVGFITYCILKYQGRADGFFLSSAANLDRWAGREYRTLWNLIFIVKGAYKFGHPQETISGVLGKNQREERINGTIRLTKLGRGLAKFLDKIDHKHCELSINDEVGWGISVLYNED